MKRSQRGLAMLAAPFFALSLSACPEEPSRSDDEKLDELVELLGERFAECVGEQVGFAKDLDPELSAVVSGDRAQFKAGVREAFERMRDSERVEFHPEHLDACLDVLETLRCDEILSSSEGPADCAKLFEGTVAAGGECAFDDECAEGHCAGADDERCGACAPYAEEGEPCGGDAICGPGLQCNFAAADPVCAPEQAPPALPKEGDACEPASGCGELFQSGLVCVSEGGSSTCVRASVVELGGACDLFGQPNATRFCKGILSTTYCDVDLAGGQTSGTCAERPSTGDACVGLALCNSFESECVEEVCVQLRAEGESCEAGVSPGCELGTDCVGDTCVDEGNAFGPGPTPVCD